MPSTDIRAPGPDGDLAGTLVSPAGSRAAVLIVPGSGPTDRNGNNPLGIHAAPYALLADGLAQHRIASVRIDKRGMFGSRQAVPDANAVTVDDYVRDTLAWVATIRQKTHVDCVWLLGHSEGGLVALATAAAYPGHICGLVLVATAGRPLGDVLKRQLRSNPANAPLLDAADRTIDALAQGRRVDPAALPPALSGPFNAKVQGFLISELALDPAQLIGKIDKPVLIVQGERDLQVGVDDAERLKQSQPSATLALLPDTNHVLKRVTTDEKAANLAAYADPDLPLAPELVETIARFIHSRATD